MRPPAVLRRCALPLETLVDTFRFLPRSTIDTCELASRHFYNASMKANEILRPIDDVVFMGSRAGQNRYSIWAFKVTRPRNRRGKQRTRKDALQRWHCSSVDEALDKLAVTVRNAFIRGRLRLERIRLTDAVVDALVTMKGEYVFARRAFLSLHDVELGAGVEPLDFLFAFPDAKRFDYHLIDLFRPTDVSDELLCWLARHDIMGDDRIEWNAQGRTISDDALIDYCWSKHVHGHSELVIRNVNVSAGVLYNITETCRRRGRTSRFFLHLHPTDDNIDISELITFGRRNGDEWAFDLPDLRQIRFHYYTDTGEITVNAF